MIFLFYFDNIIKLIVYFLMKNLYILITVTRKIANRSILFFLTFRLEMENIGISNLIRYKIDIEFKLPQLLEERV